jgi:hypothetical protein
MGAVASDNLSNVESAQALRTIATSAQDSTIFEHQQNIAEKNQNRAKEGTRWSD